jgi:hypothetical protein
MFCSNCGTRIEEEAKFCPNCGNGVGESGFQTTKPSSGMVDADSPFRIQGERREKFSSTPAAISAISGVDKLNLFLLVGGLCYFIGFFLSWVEVMSAPLSGLDIIKTSSGLYQLLSLLLLFFPICGGFIVYYFFTKNYRLRRLSVTGWFIPILCIILIIILMIIGTAFPEDFAIQSEVERMMGQKFSDFFSIFDFISLGIYVIIAGMICLMIGTGKKRPSF